MLIKSTECNKWLFIEEKAFVATILRFPEYSVDYAPLLKNDAEIRAIVKKFLSKIELSA